jgi:hypothetical protein
LTQNKNLFSWESGGAVALGEQFWDAEELVTPEENRGLIAPFSRLKKLVLEAMQKVPLDQMTYLFYSTRNYGKQ